MAHELTAVTLVPPRPSPILSAAELAAVARQILDMTTAGVASVGITHVATGITRVSRTQVRLTDSGDTLQVHLETQFGSRTGVRLSLNQLDTATLRRAVQYMEGIAHEQSGDPAPTPESLPVPPRRYGLNTIWRAETSAALSNERHAATATLMHAILDGKLAGTAFVGVVAQSKVFANKQGILASGQSTDAEMTVSTWDPAEPEGSAAIGWAGAASRNWRSLDPGAIAQTAVRLARLAAHPVVLEPGRRTAILGRPAVAQFVRAMGSDYDARATLGGGTPLSGHPLHGKILDERIMLSSDPNDPDGGYFSFDDDGYPQRAMTWLDQGRLETLAYDPIYALQCGIAESNDAPSSLRLMASPKTALLSEDEMIAECAEGVYVNRVSNIQVVRGQSGLLMGVTQGGCFLVQRGKIVKAVKDFRFVDSAYFFLNKLEAIGRSERAAFGYAPWYGDWPIAPTIVPPVMVRDFNFSALAESV